MVKYAIIMGSVLADWTPIDAPFDAWGRYALSPPRIRIWTDPASSTNGDLLRSSLEQLCPPRAYTVTHSRPHTAAARASICEHCMLRGGLDHNGSWCISPTTDNERIEHC